MIINREFCPVCGKLYSNMMSHILRETDDKHLKYIDELNTELDDLIINTDSYVAEIEETLINKNFIISKHYITQRIQKIEPSRETRILNSREMNELNPMFRSGVIDRIRSLEKDKWVEFTYKNILNKELTPIIDNEDTQLKVINKLFMDYLSKFEDTSFCSRCGSREVLQINFVDENKSNLLISNMEVLCTPCYGDFNFHSRMQPFASVSKKMSFASAHKLPHHSGKCENWHGHEWDVEVTIRKRIDPSNLMVVDFKNLKKCMNKLIVDVLDHNTLNDFIAIPTAENIIIWCWEQLMFKGHVKGIEKIRLWESKDSFAEITKTDMISVLKNKILKVCF